MKRLRPISDRSWSIASFFIIDGVTVDGLEEIYSLSILKFVLYSSIVIGVDFLGKDPEIVDKWER